MEDVPKTEVEANDALFAAHGFDSAAVLVERDERYYDFSPALNGNGDLKEVIEGDAGVLEREEALRVAIESWWSFLQGQHLLALPDTKALG